MFLHVNFETCWARVCSDRQLPDPRAISSCVPSMGRQAALPFRGSGLQEPPVSNIVTGCREEHEKGVCTHAHVYMCLLTRCSSQEVTLGRHEAVAALNPKGPRKDSPTLCPENQHHRRAGKAGLGWHQECRLDGWAGASPVQSIPEASNSKDESHRSEISNCLLFANIQR